MKTTGWCLRSVTGLALAVTLAGATRATAAEAIWIEGESSTDFTFNRHNWYQDTGLKKEMMSPGRPEITPGNWIAHYVPGSAAPAYARWSFAVAEGGSYALWLRTTPINANLRYSFDGAPLQPIDLSDYREIINITQTIDVRWLAWVKVGSATLAPGPHTLTVEAGFNAVRNDTHGGVDCLALVNYPWEPTGTLKPGEVLATPGPAVWFPLRAGDGALSPNSITDLSSLVPAPAGRFGALRRNGSNFEFEARPGVPLKLFGVDVGSILATEALQRRQARLWKKHGINLVRLHPVEATLGVLQRDTGSGQRVLDPAALDRLDRWFALLTEEGIYSEWSLFYPHVITADDGYDPLLYAELPAQGAGKSTSGVVAFMGPLQVAEWEWLRRLLDHVNPYTTRAYKNEPALALLEVHNEDSIFWHAPLNDLEQGTRMPRHTAELKRQWMEWVRAKYVTDAALTAAWGSGRRPGDSVNNPAMEIYGAWMMAAAGPDRGAGPVVAERQRLGDFIRFLAETQRSYYERRRAEILATGWKGVVVTTAWMAGGPAAQAANLWTDDAGDAIDRHSYWGGGQGGWYVAPGTVNNQSHLPTAGRGLACGFSYGSGSEIVPLYTVEDKPVVTSEWSSSPPNPWKAEAAPLHYLYGMGLQGWDASLLFAASLPRMGSGWPSNLRGPDAFVAETPHYLAQLPALVRAVALGHIREGDLVAARRLAPDAIFAGFDALSQNLPSGGWPGDNNLRTPPEVTAIGRVTFKAEAGLGAPAKTDWTAAWDTSARTVRSSTGELLWDYGNQTIEVRSAKTQGVVGRAGGRRIALPGVDIDVVTPFVSLLFTPLDDRPLIDSEHILITALARDQQLETQYNADFSQLLRVGGPPLLLEPVQATLTFKGSAVTSAKVVDIYGVPTTTDIARSGNVVTIDGRYETYYYEIKRSVQRCLSRTQASVLSPLTPPRTALFLTAPRADGITLDPSAAFAAVPYRCPFVTSSSDPEMVLNPPSRPLFFYQLDDTSATLRLTKDALGLSVTFWW